MDNISGNDTPCSKCALPLILLTSYRQYRGEELVLEKHLDPRHSRGGVAGKVADIEDIPLGEDGSIKCLVIWKPSTIAVESLVGEQLQRGREGVRGKRRGHQEVQRGL